LISEYVGGCPGCISEIPGASEFLEDLRERKNCRVAIATGGWEETAKLKLKAAGVDIKDCAFASSSDHYSREGMMRAAESMASNGVTFRSRTYFGDALWDKKACENMDYRFILVVNRFDHKESVKNFSDKDYIIAMLGI
jgi:phosphoglycolate phosphatase-like HAD superfamily hydrolase